MKRFHRLLAGAVWLASAQAWAAVDFNRDIRPVLSDKCFTCHGPDESNRKMSKLRLDSEAAAKIDLPGGKHAIVAGDPAQSDLYVRVSSKSPANRMPPVYSGKTLTPAEIELFKQWIAEGAKWQKHWSLIAPTRPHLPKVQHSGWPRNPIDAFVLERLEREGLAPSPEASKARLIRRVSLDLTGLPPTPAEVDAFLDDSSPGAYEKVVDRLLASPRYGERMAARWLDGARYADTNGYQTDAERYMWRWRDWVIQALNRNKPFDEFTIEQIAGDLLPHPTLEQRIATGFNRNHRGNGEGGIIAEEYAAEYVIDRIETTATVFLGLTMGCARCHSHKYDPIAHKEFYQFYAFFNNIPERGRAFKYGNSPPFIKAPTPDQEAKLKDLDAKVGDAEKQFRSLDGEARAARQRWEKTLPASAEWAPPAGLAAEWNSSRGAIPLAPATEFDPKKTAHFTFYDRFTLAAWVKPASAKGGPVITRADDIEEGSGYGLYIKNGHVQANYVLRWLDDALRIETEAAIPPGEWSHVMVSYDGTRMAEGVRMYINGKPQKLKILLDELNQDFKVKDPVRVGAGGGPAKFDGQIDAARIYNRVVGESEATVLALADPLGRIAAIPENKRTPAQRDLVEWSFLDRFGPARIRDSWRRLNDARAERAAFYDAIPTVMVMEEMDKPRQTRILLRGQYDKLGDPVQAGVPAALPPLPEGAPANRLGLAKWLVAPENPLTARVAVNRFWQMYFGTGIVKTVEDFGSQGEWPSHPALLDWLAVEFRESGWDIKHMQKLIVTSATYRQSSRLRPELEQKDPENRLLGRGPRVRLPAETVRDQALAASGLLVEKIGGPSVKPYQPAGLWKELSGAEEYPQDHGEGLYRRSLYTFWKRASPPPSLMNFDAAAREACVVRENRTNTPLQALNLMNDVTYLEAARKIGERMMKEGGQTPAQRIAYGFRLITSRRPGEKELGVLIDSYRYYLDRYRTDPKAALKLVSQGESPRDEALDTGEHAAYSASASLILNLDEVITKE